MGKLAWLALILLLSIIIIILVRLPEDALTMAVGVFLGLIAMALVLFAWALAQRNRPPEQPKQQHQVPPVVVIQGGQQQPQLGPPPSLPLPGGTGERSYEVVGDFSEEERQWRDDGRSLTD
jgi:hypothetical protein